MQEIDRRRSFRGRRLLFVARRHLAGTQAFDDRLSPGEHGATVEIGVELVESQIGLSRFRTVTTNAMLLKEGDRRRVEPRGHVRLGACGCVNHKQQNDRQQERSHIQISVSVVSAAILSSGTA